MRKIGHLTPRYVIDRIGEIAFQRMNPEYPWLTPAACRILDDLLRPSDIGIEFGSGRSTLWLARKISHITSIEHDTIWHERVASSLREHSIDNCDLRLVTDRASYAVDALNQRPDHSLDLVIVDGVERSACALNSLRKIKPGGILVLDDSQRYVPSCSRAPGAIDPGDLGNIEEGWRQFIHHTRNFRRIQTSSGVSDTMFFLVR